MARTRVKICGIRDPRMAEVAIDAGADAIGVVLAAKSPRQVTIETALEIARGVPVEIAVVAVVTMDDPWQELLEGWPGVVQMHGPWTADEGERRRTTAPPNPRLRSLIRGIPWSLDAALAADAAAHVAALLIDGPSGGSGRAFDHRELAPVMSRLSKPVIIAGGMRPETVGEIISLLHPYGVDVSSGVESSLGVKDPGAIRAFCDAVRQT